MGDKFKVIIRSEDLKVLKTEITQPKSDEIFNIHGPYMYDPQ